MNLTLLTIAVAIICTSYRLIPMLIARKASIPFSVRVVLQQIPVAIFAILIALDLFFWNDQFNLNPFENLKLIAGVAAIICAFLTKNLLLTMVVGTGTLAVLMLVL